jgi:hypothetical protein
MNKKTQAMPRNRNDPGAWFELAVTTIGDRYRLMAVELA